jgi:hypothetical protein
MGFVAFAALLLCVLNFVVLLWITSPTDIPYYKAGGTNTNNSGLINLNYLFKKSISFSIPKFFESLWSYYSECTGQKC